MSMSHMRNLRKFSSLLKWAQISGIGFPLRLTINPRFLTTVVAESSGKRWSQNEIRKMAQVAMLDYFYYERGLQFPVAESMSKNAPLFNGNLLKKLNCNADDDFTRAITRFLRFHPINEFEPFFESLGLKPLEYRHLLPNDKMFLKEDAFLLENYNTFLNYGIGLKQMGKIFKEAWQVFGYETGVLASKLQAFEDFGLTKPFVSRVIVCCPSILMGDMNVELVKVAEILKSVGIEVDWVIENLSEEGSYDWSSIHRVLSLLGDLYIDDNELGDLIKKHPGLVFEDSGEWTLFLAGFQTKLGLSRTELSMFFQKFPDFQVKKCALNLRRCFVFLSQIEMEADEICKIFRSHSLWLGTCRLKKASTIGSRLNVGIRRLCQIIQQNPEEMRKWAMGLKVQPLPGTAEEETWMKTKFLLDLGYKESTKEIEGVIKHFKGRGSKLQQRFDFLVSLGIKDKDVREMVRTYPNILSQESHLLETKVKYMVNELGYPLSSFVAFPSCLRFTLQRIKLRLGLVSCLKGNVKAVTTLLACPDKHFMSCYVNRHPDGSKHWEDLKKQL